MRKRSLRCVVMLITTVWVARVAPAASLASVALDAKAISSGQIRTAPLRRIVRAPLIAAYGIVLDPGALVRLSTQLVAERGKVTVARARAALARSEAGRAADLYRAQHNISQAALQTALSDLQIAVTDQATVAAQLSELKVTFRARWGTRLAAAAASGTAPLPQLESGAEVLVEVSLPLGQALVVPPVGASATTPDGEQVALRLVSRAPRVAAGVAGQSLFYLMVAQNSAPIGTPLAVALSGAAENAGVLVPGSAVVWHNGRALAYRETTPGLFLPVPVCTSFGTDEGYFVPQDRDAGLHPGDRIVIDGAALLYSASQSPPSAARTTKSGDNDD